MLLKRLRLRLLQMNQLLKRLLHWLLLLHHLLRLRLRLRLLPVKHLLQLLLKRLLKRRRLHHCLLP